MGKHAQSIDSKILGRIHRRRDGWVFTPTDFLDLGSRAAVASTLKRQKRAGTIRQITRGVYDVPRKDPQLGLVSPSVDSIVAALKGRDAIRLQPSGAYAANLLGLSDQVPMKIVFLTDGPLRHVQVGKLRIVNRRTTPRNMATAGKASGLAIQALRHIGRRFVNDGMVTILRKRFSMTDKQQLLKDLRYAPAWIAEILRKVARPNPN